MSSRRCAIARACKAGNIPRYAADLATTRGRCQHGRCKGRWAVTRVTLDLRYERAERFAALECTLCGRIWRRVKVPAIRSAAGYQAVRLTLILGGTVTRWRARGRWHREGSDQVIRDADLGDVDEAVRTHRVREDARLDVKARAKAKAEAESAERHRDAQEWLARMDERNAAREAEERAAEAREAANAR